MNCDKMQDLLALMAGGEIEQHERMGLEAHLGVCTDCARELSEYREMRDLLASLREGTAPAGTFEHLSRQLKLTHTSTSRAAIFGWAIRAAAVLVIGLSFGYTANSIAARFSTQPTAPTARLDADLGDTGASIVPGFVREANGGSPYSMYPTRGGFTINLDATGTFRTPARQDGTYYLPRVETILNPDEVDF